MKKKLLAVAVSLVVTHVNAFNPLWSIYIQQTINNVNQMDDIWVPVPADNADGILYVRGSDKAPGMITAGTGLSISSGVMNVDFTQQLNPDWNAVSGARFISNKPTLFSGSYLDLSNKPDLSVYATTTSVSTALVGKYDTSNPAGYVAQAGARSAISLTTTGTSGSASYNNVTGVLNIPAYTSSNGTVTSVSAGTGLTGGTITTTGSISMPSVGTSGTYGKVTTDAQGRVTSGSNKSFNYVTRPVNTCFQVSATQDARVVYNVDIVASATLVGGQRGTIHLEEFTDSGCTTGTQLIMSATSGNTNALAVALGNVLTQTLTVQGPLRAGRYAKIRTQNNTGTPTFTAMPGSEETE